MSLVSPQGDPRPHHIPLGRCLAFDQRQQFGSFLLGQLHWRCMTTSAHPDMLAKALNYSSHLRDVVLALNAPHACNGPRAVFTDVSKIQQVSTDHPYFPPKVHETVAQSGGFS